MNQHLFSERVNAVSSMINNMSSDPGERLGIATSVCEIYKFELQKYFSIIPAPGVEDEKGKPVTTAENGASQ